ncbi:hypothetical protein LTS10_009986 [Elasticomyces elasticus]|nr:hypothetical protein LTS10_009986 [Elasticomyces elasticus]
MPAVFVPMLLAGNTAGSGSYAHISPHFAAFLWVAISTITLGIAGLLLGITIRISDAIVRYISKPSGQPASRTKLRWPVSLCFAISSLGDLVAGIVAITVHRNHDGWPNEQMRMILLYIHVALLAMEGCTLPLAILGSKIAKIRNRGESKADGDHPMEMFETRPVESGLGAV